MKKHNLRLPCRRRSSSSRRSWPRIASPRSRLLKAPFPFLSDAQGRLQSLYGTRSPEYHNPKGVSVNTPTLVLIDRKGIIRWIHQAQSYKKRSPVAADLAQARKLK